MYALGKKPVIALGTTAMIALSVGGISAQARSSVAGTTPQAGQVGKGRGIDTAALAKQLGVSETALQTAMDAVRTELGAPDRSADLKAEAQAIADSLGVDVSTITTVLQAQVGKTAKATDAAPTTPPADAARPTTPRSGGKGGHGKRPDQAALITAIVNATGKSQADVKTALEAGRTAHAKAEAAQQAKFAALLAAKLGLETSKVTAALDAVKPVRPAQAAKASASSTS